jgi:hypothetical protein
MTKGDTRKLAAIIGRLEALQHETRNDRARDRMGRAKSELIACLTIEGKLK